MWAAGIQPDQGWVARDVARGAEMRKSLNLIEVWTLPGPYRQSPACRSVGRQSQHSDFWLKCALAKLELIAAPRSRRPDRSAIRSAGRPVQRVVEGSSLREWPVGNSFKISRVREEVPHCFGFILTMEPAQKCLAAVLAVQQFQDTTTAVAHELRLMEDSPDASEASFMVTRLDCRAGWVGTGPESRQDAEKHVKPHS